MRISSHYIKLCVRGPVQVLLIGLYNFHFLYLLLLILLYTLHLVLKLLKNVLLILVFLRQQKNLKLAYAILKVYICDLFVSLKFSVWRSFYFPVVDGNGI